MRIAMIVNSFPSLSEKFLINQIAGLVKKGIEIDIYAAVLPDSGQVHSLFTEYELEKRTIQLAIPKTPKKRFLKLPFLVAKNLFRNPFSLFRTFSVSKYQRAARNLKTLYFLDAFYGKKYDIIHCQFGQNGLIGAFLKDCGFADKLMVTFHGSDITVFPKKEGAHVYDYMFSRADAVTAGTRFTANLIKAYGCKKEKLHIIPAGVIADKYPAVSYTGRQDELLLSVGRLEEVKGFKYSILAFSMIAGTHPGLHYIIAGEGSGRRELQDLISENHLDGRVILVGEKNDTEILKLYQEASIFIAPSVRASNGSEEGQGLVIQEAEISGLPVIATSTGGIPDGIVDSITGFLVPEKNSSAIAEKITFLLSNKAVSQKMGDKGRVFARENYDIPVLTEKIILIYESFYR